MSEVKTLTISGSSLVNNGQYVRIEDYAALKAECDALAAALTAQPDSAPCDWVYIRFTDISKSQRMKCQIAWSDWLNSVIYDEEGAPLLISNSAFQVIRAGEPS